MKASIKTWLTEQIGADEALLQMLYDEYRTTITTQLAQARTDLAAADFPALDRTAHALKGAALATGDNEMLEPVLALRDAAKASDGAAAATAVEKIAALAAQL